MTELKNQINKAFDSESEIVVKVDYSNLEQGINLFLKSQGIDKEFELTVEHECSNDTSLTFDVDAGIDDSEIKELKDGNFYFRCGDILRWMCKNDLILAGEYLVNVSW